MVSLSRSINNGSIDVKMERSVLEEKSSFKMVHYLALSLLLKLPPRKLEL